MGFDYITSKDVLWPSLGLVILDWPMIFMLPGTDVESWICWAIFFTWIATFVVFIMHAVNP